MKNNLLIVSFLFFCAHSFITAQEELIIDSKLYVSYGFNIGAGSWTTTKKNYTYLDIGPVVNLRYNFFEANNNNAFGVDFTPSVGTFMNSEVGAYLGFSFPLMVSYNLGLGATHYSDLMYGLALKVGLETDFGPLAGDQASDFRAAVFYPAAQFNIRFIKSRRIRDLSVRYGYLPYEANEDNFIIYGSAKYLISY